LRTKRSQSSTTPKAELHQAPSAVAHPPVPESRPRIRVTVVDDEPDIHRAIEYILETADDFVFSGSYLTGAEALQGILAHPPDLVLMDIRLPDVSGIECTRRLALALPQLRIVMISALDDWQTVEAAIEAGCHHYVTKPFLARQFLIILRCAMTSRIAGIRSQNHQEQACPLRQPSGVVDCDAIRDREAKVLNGLRKGRLYKEIADELKMSPFVVNKLARQAFQKLGAKTRHQAVAQWIFCSNCPQLIVRVSARRGRSKEGPKRGA
jgi:DNA-binding NarL/FixJ family response regulator